MMFSTNAVRCVLLLSLSLSGNAETIRGVQRELERDLTSPGTATVDLQTAGNYAILAGTGITTVPSSVITGDIAVYPAALAAMTGFSFTSDSTGAALSTQIVGETQQVSHQAYGKGGTVDDDLSDAVDDMELAYNDAAARTISPNNDDNYNFMDGLLDGQTLTPGVYDFTTGVSLKGDITFSGTGVFIIKMTGNLVQAGMTNVILADGAAANKIFWQVAGTVSVGAGAHMKGIILGNTSVAFVTGSSLDGRVFAKTSCALQKATITQSI